MEPFVNQDPRSYFLFFGLKIWFRARKVTGTFEKRTPGLHTVFFQFFAVMHFGDIAGKQIHLYYVTENEATQNN